MTATPSPFAERKTSRWVWLMPSVVLHLVVLFVWLSMPEEPPRQPGQRELTIDAKQAEQLQELVEDSNLRELRGDVATMQAIKERMARIRAEKMKGLQTFEQEMLQEAPIDVAGLISEVLAVQESVRELGVNTLDTLVRIREASAPVEKLLEEDEPIAAVRALKDIQPVRNEIEGVRDVLEEKVNTSIAIAGNIRTRTEWISDPEVLERIDGFLEAVETMNEEMNALNREIGGSVGGRPRRFFNELVADGQSAIETLQAFNQMENSEEAKKAKAETEAKLEERQQSLAKLNKELRANQERVKTLDGEEKKRLSKEINQQQSKIKTLEWYTSRNKSRLERKNYLPDRDLQKRDSRVKWMLKQAFRRPANPDAFRKFLERQEAFVQNANELRTTLEAM